MSVAEQGSWVGRAAELVALTEFLQVRQPRGVRLAQVLGEPRIGKTALVARARAGLPELLWTDNLRDALAVTDRRGVTVLLEDLHRADADTVALLRTLLRCPGRVRLTVLVCYRPRQLSTAVQALLDETDGLRLELGPLSRQDCAELLGESVGPHRLTELHAASGGNPCHLRSLASGPTAGARTALLSEVDELGAEGALVLRAAAVVGQQITADLIAPASGCSSSVVGQALDAALAADLLRAKDDGPVLEFRHPVVRDIVYRAAPHSWRLAAHRRVAAVLADLCAPAPERARQLEFAARPGDQESAGVLVRAARELRSREPATAARWLTVAQRLHPARDLRLDLADTLIAAGQAEAGMALFQEVVGSAGPLALRALIRYSAVERMFGRHLTARALLRRALASWPDGDPVELAAVREELAYAHYNTGDPEGAAALARQVLATELPRPAALIHAACHALLAYCHWEQGRPDPADQEADRVIALVDEATIAELAEWLPVAEQCVGIIQHLGRYAVAERQGARMRSVAARTGQRLVLVRGHLRAAAAQVLTGDWAGAEVHLADTAELAAQLGRPPVLAYALVLRSYLAGERGEAARALALAEEAVELAPAGDHPWCAQVRLQLAESRWALDLPVPPGFLAGQRNLLPPCQLEMLTASAVRRGELAEAEDWAQRCRELAQDPGGRAYATLAEARLMLARGVPVAVRWASQAAEEFAATPLRPGHGRALLLLGTALAQRGDREAALVELEAASAIFAEVGANRLREQALRVQRGLGRRVSRAAGRVAPGELTEREREVAGLVSQGCTNRVIAERLTVSERTVTTHVTNILAKTGVSSRTALAARLLRD